MPRRNVTSLKGYSIRDVKHTDGDKIAVKLHSKIAKRSIWISIPWDGLFDQDGNLYENNAEYVPQREIWPAG